MSHYTGYIKVIDDQSSQETLQLLSEFVMLYGEKYVITREYAKVTKKEHYHYYVLLPATTKPETARKAWKRKFPRHNGSKNEKSFTPVRTDQEKCLRYICKDGEISVVHGFDRPYLIQLGKEWVDPTQYTKDQIGKIRKFAEESKEILGSEEDCARIVFRYFLVTKKTMSKYRMKDLVYTLWCQQEPERSEHDFVYWYKEKAR